MMYSVLMSVYYREEASYLRQSIESMLNQTLQPDEFVLVCDGPLTEALDEVVAFYETEYPKIFCIIRLPECRGLGNALNTGLKYCHNNLVARMDSDDISVKNRCEDQMKCFETMDADIVGGAVCEFETKPEEYGKIRMLPETPGEIKKFAARRNPFNHPAVMFKKNKVLQAGSYIEIKGFEDYYLWARMLMDGAKGYNLQDILVYMRTGAGMYHRRGGADYMKTAVKFRRKLCQMGISTKWDFVVSAGGQILVSAMPEKIRKYIYVRFLRK